jgi:hypothetical protein
VSPPPELWIPAGTWAEWFAALGTTSAVAFGTITWSRDRRRTLYLEESEQARRVAAIFDIGTGLSGWPTTRSRI